MKDLEVGGKELQEIKVMKDNQLRDVIGKVMTSEGLKDFYRPINFKDDFVTSVGMLRQPVSENAGVILNNKLIFNTLVSYDVY